MKVKRSENGSYKIEGAKYIRLEIGYITENKKCYELLVDSINKPKWKVDRIFYTKKLETLKMFLAQYETEKDLLADYYIARLEGKYELIYRD